MIQDYKIGQLLENYQNYLENFPTDKECDPQSFREYAELESENDPDFFRWLFNDGDISDFGTNLDDKQREEYAEFLDGLEDE